MSGISGTTTTYTAYRPEWLALHKEEAIAPEQPIIDAHHHLWDLPRPRYLTEDLIADVNGGHDVRATVYVECRSMYRADGPSEMRSVGEVEFANGVAAIGGSGAYGATRLCAAIVGHVDLRLGGAARPVLEAMVDAGNGRFRGIRQASAWDADSAVISPAVVKPPGMLGDPLFRQGFASLAPLGLSFDAFLYHHQLGDLVALARAFPDTRIILDHIGAPIGIGAYADRRDAVFDEWRRAMAVVASCPNIIVKIGGLGMRLFGFGFDALDRPAPSQHIAQSWAPYVHVCIDAFGPARCMFESNFPPDKGSCCYGVLWNAFKRIAARYTRDERMALFHDTAARCYRIDLPRREDAP